MRKPWASVSLDLDNHWSYLKTRGDERWKSHPSYLDLLIPRVLDLLAKHSLKITFFVVGQDAAIAANQRALRMISEAGHEVGNHSFHHEPWLHLYTRDQIEREIVAAEEAIERATGARPAGFRGPGYSYSPDLLALLARRGYAYDASTFPTFLGPLARLYYFMTSGISRQERKQRDLLFGSWRNGLLPLRPYVWPGLGLLEMPVTTMPVFKIPIQPSYVLYLARFSRAAALLYYETGLALCRATGVAPSILLHPLDFLGADDPVEGLAFFPAMDLPAARKLSLMDAMLGSLAARHEALTMSEHARRELGRIRSSTR